MSLRYSYIAHCDFSLCSSYFFELSKHFTVTMYCFFIVWWEKDESVGCSQVPEILGQPRVQRRPAQCKQDCSAFPSPRSPVLLGLLRLFPQDLHGPLPPTLVSPWWLCLPHMSSDTSLNIFTIFHSISAHTRCVVGVGGLFWSCEVRGGRVIR